MKQAIFYKYNIRYYELQTATIKCVNDVVTQYKVIWHMEDDDVRTDIITKEEYEELLKELKEEAIK